MSTPGHGPAATVGGETSRRNEESVNDVLYGAVRHNNWPIWDR